MLEITLGRLDSIETVLSTIELAMECGDVCQIYNINYLGINEVVAIKMLAMAENLLDVGSGKICRAQPGFHLIGVDECGFVSKLV